MAIKNRKRSIALIASGLFLILILIECGTFQVSVQVVTTPTPARNSLPNYVFADSIVLDGYSLPSLEVSTSDQLPLRLYWQVTDNPPHPYAVGISLRGADGTLVWNASGQTVFGSPFCHFYFYSDGQTIRNILLLRSGKGSSGSDKGNSHKPPNPRFHQSGLLAEQTVRNYGKYKNSAAVCGKNYPGILR